VYRIIVSSVNEIYGRERAGPAERERGGRAEAAAGFLAAIGAVRRATRRAARTAWQAEPLPQAQSELLRLVVARPGLSVAEAADELLLAPNTISTLIGRLAAQGLIDRNRSGPDGRSVKLNVTAVGDKHVAQWRDLRAELAGRALAQLDGDDQRAIGAAVPAMLRLAERIKAHGARAGRAGGTPA
jgi:DNA-binding MarR family transcriptional regulator